MKKQEKRKRKANGANRRRRINKTGTLERRGNKWLARWYVYTPQGKRIRKSQTIDADSIADARARLNELTEGNALITREKLLERTQKELEGVSAALKDWEDSLPVLSISNAWTAYKKNANRPDTGERTLKDYEGYYFGLVEWLKENFPDAQELRDITRTEADAFAKYLRNNRSAGTHNKRIVFFRHFWRTLSDDTGKDPQAKDPTELPAKLTCNPWEKIQKREANTHTRRELSTDELVRVCAPLTGEMQLLFAIGIYTGLRLGDCALLTWSNVDLNHNHITTVPHKTKRHAHGKHIMIPIHSELAAILEGTPPNKRTGFVMPETAAAYKREPSILTNRIQAHFRACGIQTAHKRDGDTRATVDVGFHSLRHTFVSLSANAGAPLAIVQAIVGHSNPAMTRHYFHGSETALRGAVAALPNVIHQSPDGQATAINAATSPTGRETAEVLPLGESGEKSRLEAFKAAFLALTTVERDSAEKWIAENRNTVNVA